MFLTPQEIDYGSHFGKNDDLSRKSKVEKNLYLQSCHNDLLSYNFFFLCYRLKHQISPLHIESHYSTEHKVRNREGIEIN